MENFDFEKDSKSSEEPADVSETVNEENTCSDISENSRFLITTASLSITARTILHYPMPTIRNTIPLQVI